MPNKSYSYHLGDSGGSSLVEKQELLLPIGTIFRHEYGFYEVRYYLNDNNEEETRYSLITQVDCERVFKNK